VRQCSVILTATILVALTAAPAAAAPKPIAPGGPTSLPAFSGAPALPGRVPGVRQPPRHPFMAPNGRSNLHNDAFQTDAYTWSGPLGRSPRTLSNAIGRTCGGIAMDRRKRLVAVCVGLSGPRLYMFDRRTLNVLAELDLPGRLPAAPGTNIFQDFTGGGYFYLDDKDRVVTATTTRHVYVIAQTAGRPGFAIQRDYDLSGVLGPEDRIASALPDFSGQIWFVTRPGRVGTIDPGTGAIKVIALGEGIQNSFAVGERGEVYVITDRALYRMQAGPDGTPRTVWREQYRNIGTQKPGQADAGSGTTPTLTQDGNVAITDNADPMNVVVYRRAASVSGPRLVCEEPVFQAGAGATENSLIAAGRALLVENNHGYTGPDAVSGGKLSTPGFARVDVDRDGQGCRTVWTNRSERAPSVVPKLSLESGLVYTYTKPADPTGADPWFWTALDFRTGRRVFRRLAGTGGGFNNNYPAIILDPDDGTAYLGTLGGITALRDSGGTQRLRLRVRRDGRQVRFIVSAAGRPISGATVRIAGRSVRTRPGGRAILRLSLPAGAGYRVVARKPGYLTAAVTLTVRR